MLPNRTANNVKNRWTWIVPHNITFEAAARAQAVPGCCLEPGRRHSRRRLSGSRPDSGIAPPPQSRGDRLGGSGG